MPPPSQRPTDKAGSARPRTPSGEGGAGPDEGPRQVPVDELSYEQARDELISVVTRLEAGGETLEGSLQLWERGEALAARCQHWLDGARRRLQAVSGAEGTTGRETDAPDEEIAR